MGFSLVLAGLLWFTHLLAIRRRFTTLTDAALGAFVLAVAQVVVSARVLALLGALRAVPLALLNLFLLGGVLLAGSRGLPAAWQDTWRRLRGFLHLFRRSPLPLVLTLAAAELMAAALWQAVLLPEASYDGLAYHLPMAFSRLQFGDARTIVGWPMWLSSSPEHSELLMVWTVLLDGTAALVDAVQWAFWPAAFLACYGLARKLGAAPMSSWAGGALLALAPAVALQAGVAYNDLVTATLFLVALNLLTARAVLPTALAGTALGLIAGIKYAGLIFPLVGGVALLLSDPPWRPGPTFWRRAPALGLPVLLLGAPWYIANWARFGNPIWPFIVWAGDWQLFHGQTSARAIYSYALDPQYRALPGWLLAPFFWLEPQTLYHYEARYAGLGPLWPVLGIPSFLYLLTSFRRLRGPALTVTLVGLGGAFFLTPYNWIPRYVLFLLGLGAIGTAWVLHAGSAWTRRVAWTLLTLGAAYALWTVGPLGMTPPGQLEAAARLPAALRPTIGLSDMPAYRWLEENSYDGARVVYGLGLYWIAPLWESDLDNEVLYVEQRIPEFWHPAVAALGANYVFVERHPYNDWIGSAGRLAPVYVDGRFAIYRVHPQEPVR